MNSQQKAVQVLQYASPLAVFLYSIITIIMDTCKVVPSKPKSKRLRKASLSRSCSLVLLILAIIVCYVAEGATLIATAVRHVETPSQADIVHVIASTLLWTAIGLREHPDPNSYYGPSIISAVFGIPVFVICVQNAIKDITGTLQLVIQILQIVLFTALSIVTISFAYRKRTAKDEENDPLLNGSANSKISPAYGAAPTSDAESECDDLDEDDKYIKDRRKERLEKSGSWWTYLKAFSIFIPFLIPSKKDSHVQICIVLTILCILGSRALNLLIPRQLGIIGNKLASGGLPFTDLGIWLILSILNGSAGLGLIQNFARVPIEQFSYRQITNAAFTHVMQLSVDFHNDKDSAEVMKAVDQGQSVNNLLESCLLTIGPSLFDLLIGYVYFYKIFDVYASGVLLAASVIYVYLDVKTTSWNMLCRRQTVKDGREESKVMHQAVQGWQTVSYFNRFDYENSRFAEAVRAYQASSRKYRHRSYYARAIMKIVITMAFVSVSALALFRISRGEASPGDWVFLISYWSTLIAPLTYLSNYYRWLSADLIDAERLLVLLQTKPTVISKDDAKELDVTRGQVSLKAVSFAYDQRKSTLTNIDITAAPGQTVALVGETGGGKSTILKLLYRFYDVSGGAIEIDGQDIRNVTLHSLREALGVVPQDPALFNLSIIENLRYARLDASDEEIHDACRAAAVHDKIMTFPGGYQSKVGERGVKLSGGELQRVAIAQILLKNPRIVLLDEATSAVDSDTEALIQSAFRKLCVGRTTFVIAHRLSTVFSVADKIVVIEGGTIIEQGNHEELVRLNGKYNSLWSKQVAHTLGSVDQGHADLKVEFSQKSSESITPKKETQIDNSNDDGASLADGKSREQADRNYITEELRFCHYWGVPATCVSTCCVYHRP